MSQPITIVAQGAMDNFYQNYKSGSDFFDIDDFIYYSGATLSDFYRQLYQTKYQENRADKKDEVLSFANGLLLNQDLDVKLDENGNYAAKVINPVFTFTYDNNNTGYQEVFPLKPNNTKLERSSIVQVWQFDYLPATNRIFWYVEHGVIYFFNKGRCNINKVRLYYVPAISSSMLVPDELTKLVIDTTVKTMRELGDKTVVKKSLDQNINRTLQTEIDLSQLK